MAKKRQDEIQLSLFDDSSFDTPIKKMLRMGRKFGISFGYRMAADKWLNEHTLE